MDGGWRVSAKTRNLVDEKDPESPAFLESILTAHHDRVTGSDIG